MENFFFKVANVTISVFVRTYSTWKMDAFEINLKYIYFFEKQNAWQTFLQKMFYSNYFTPPPPHSHFHLILIVFLPNGPLCLAAAVRAVGCRCARKLSTGTIGPRGPRRSLKCQTSRQRMRMSSTFRRATVTEKGAAVTPQIGGCDAAMRRGAPHDGPTDRRADARLEHQTWVRGKPVDTAGARMTSFSSPLAEHMRFWSFKRVFGVNSCGAQWQITNPGTSGSNGRVGRKKRKKKRFFWHTTVQL